MEICFTCASKHQTSHLHDLCGKSRCWCVWLGCWGSQRLFMSLWPGQMFQAASPGSSIDCRRPPQSAAQAETVAAGMSHS